MELQKKARANSTVSLHLTHVSLSYPENCLWFVITLNTYGWDIILIDPDGGTNIQNKWPYTKKPKILF